MFSKMELGLRSLEVACLGTVALVFWQTFQPVPQVQVDHQTQSLSIRNLGHGPLHVKSTQILADQKTYAETCKARLVPVETTNGAETAWKIMDEGNQGIYHILKCFRQQNVRVRIRYGIIRLDHVAP